MSVLGRSIQTIEFPFCSRKLPIHRNPQMFVAVNLLISASPDLDPKKRHKDALQADLVAHLIETRLPLYQLKPTDSSTATHTHEDSGKSDKLRW